MVLPWSSAVAVDLTFVSFNVESDADTTPSAVARDISRIPASDVWALSEVSPRDFETYRMAVGENYRMFRGSTGGSDRLAIIYDPDVLSVVDEAVELSDAGGSRHPLMAVFAVNETNEEVWVVANHLQRGSGEDAAFNGTRQNQAAWLNRWAAEHSEAERVPSMVLIGDFNFDVSQSTRRGNRSYEIFTRNGIFRWVEPSCLADSSCPATGTQCNPRFGSILDFVFLAGAAREWEASSEILFKNDPTYCENDDDGGADHFPVRAVLSF